MEEFRPEGFEVKFEGGRIDRLDIMEEPEKNRGPCKGH